MVLLIQNTQNRDNGALQAKLGELIRAAADADNNFIGIEHIADEELTTIVEKMEQNARELHRERRRSETAIETKTIPQNPENRGKGARAAKIRSRWRAKTSAWDRLDKSASLRLIRPMVIYVDADACPVKEEIYKVARRLALEVRVVANSFIRTPVELQIQFVLVAAGADAADDWIADRAGRGDVVVTNDIPLAARALEKGAEAISPTAKVFTTDMIGSALATRGLMEHLRSFGEITSGPKPFAQKDRSAFLSALDAAVNRAKKKAV